jgi:hypothetical protein
MAACLKTNWPPCGRQSWSHKVVNKVCHFLTEEAFPDLKTPYKWMLWARAPRHAHPHKQWGRQLLKNQDRRYEIEELNVQVLKLTEEWSIFVVVARRPT